ncbi:hypothetical protein Fot_35599 [Forsythia ovata]|uniref:Uncharacterized protein n=1 Tax=Forsythia ovata TaxID=205694 RepID=A0ABD1SMN6_9LAMI
MEEETNNHDDCEEEVYEPNVTASDDEASGLRMPTTRSGMIYSPTMDLAHITQVLDRLSTQLTQLEARIQKQSASSEHRLAELEAAIQNDEESVGGGNSTTHLQRLKK